MPFHPAVSGWLAARFGQPTEVQSRAWAVTAQHRHTLIAAPTGSGKTLAAFLSAINDLVVEGLARGGLSDQVHVLYVSPLKALSNDIRRNLQEPLAGIRQRLVEMGLPDVGIRDAVRTGDTPAAERERMRREPPHILVTTPESLYILLTSASGRAMLKSVQTLIVDELHAVAGVKRGAHLALTLERLEALCERPPVRIGLSATVKPLDAMARFLIGERGAPPSRPQGARSPLGGQARSAEGGAIDSVEIIDAGHVRERDLAIEIPRSPLTAVMATEVWAELYDRLAELIAQHRTTLIFVNQRRIAERAARHLAERIGEEHVTAHHGSLAREHRLDAEQRLKSGALKALVATSSLELGIDIGDIDLVCQLGSPRSINAFVQRVGRAGHAIGAIPKGRLFPLALDDLLECAALLDAVRRGELDRIGVPDKPLDALAQQIIAEAACRDWPLDELYAHCRLAEPYRGLTLAEFERVVQMLADGYATRRGRRGAYLHFDAVNRVLRARRGARLAAVTNAGVIPDQFDYDVVLLPEEHRVGTLNEDFAFESLAGDVFQLGNASYRIVKVETGKVLVEDAKGQPPSMPFWLGESLGRTVELSDAVSRLSAQADAVLDDGVEACERWLHEDLSLPPPAAQQLALYLGASKAALGVLPTARRIVFERFFDEVGDMHLVIHSPYGSRINRAWGLTLRKRMCRKFNFELQASALEDSIVLSLGPTHSFALDEVRHYLKSATAPDLLVQALLDAPMFGTRWRWNATASLAVRRMNGGRKVPPQFQRSDAQDLLTVVFPEQQACAENLVGEREIPDHPLVTQTLHDCLHETMDVDGFVRLLQRIEAGEIEIVARDLASPSPLSHAILNARPYAFLDDVAAEERRTKAVATKALMDLQTAHDIGRLDPQVIAQVREDAWPEIASADELHDALCVHGFLAADEIALPEYVESLAQQRRATRITVGNGRAVRVAAERLHELLAVFPDAAMAPPIAAVRGDRPERDAALRELLRGRLELLGPVTAGALAAPLGLDAGDMQVALLQLEADGSAMRGAFTAPDADEWCDRRLLARMHRATRDKLRADIQSVPPAQFMRFLFRWHQLVTADSDERREGEGGLADVLRQLEGHAAPASAWEDDLLAARVRDYEPAMLDRLCAVGRVVWWRPFDGADAQKSGPIRGTPIVLAERDALPHWQAAAGAVSNEDGPALSSRARAVLQALREHGASFFSDLQRDVNLLGETTEQALAELVAQGLVTCDTFAGLRALVMPADRRNKLRRRHPGHDPIDDAGRWSLTRRTRAPVDCAGALAEPHVDHIARVLLRRYGVVFRKLLEREGTGLPPWRDLHYVYRRLEARGEVRGGRFVSGFSGEQFALPEAAAALRKIARHPAHERVSISAVDPLNLAGIITPGERIPRLPGNRLLFEGGVPIAVQSGGEVRYLTTLDPAAQWAVKNLLIRRQRPGSYVEGAGTAQ
ncbi:MAG TPA: DEAD/DEAH box helicase [Burkholderiaceae bacterium]|nr:DEAD/DEAH box helicase [Burkholderiaceae bacterium]